MKYYYENELITIMLLKKDLKSYVTLNSLTIPLQQISLIHIFVQNSFRDKNSSNEA